MEAKLTNNFLVTDPEQCRQLAKNAPTISSIFNNLIRFWTWCVALSKYGVIEFACQISPFPYSWNYSGNVCPRNPLNSENPILDAPNSWSLTQPERADIFAHNMCHKEIFCSAAYSHLSAFPRHQGSRRIPRKFPVNAIGFPSLNPVWGRALWFEFIYQKL